MPILQQSNSDRKVVTLSERLSAIAESLPEKCFVCDVGSDHGTLPLYLLSSGRCDKVIVTDLNEKPLERARRNLQDAGLDKMASFILTDGIEAVLPMNPDAFVIAGMGGETIVGILDRGLKYIQSGTVFILQPMTKLETLRRYLYEFGFAVIGEKLVSENNKFFVVISAVYDGISRKEKINFCSFGEFLPNDFGETSKAYFSALLSSVENVIKGKQRAGVACEEDVCKRDVLLKILEDCHDNQGD